VKARHLRPRGDGVEQPITTVELFFDLVYVFAVTQLSHLILGDPTVAGIGRAAFLLLIVWWAWIYTTWELRTPAHPALGTRLGAPTDATGGLMGDLWHVEQQPEGTP
jgi:hypothetical protein